MVEAFGGFMTLIWLGLAFGLGVLMLRHHKLAVMATLFGDLRAGVITPSSLFTLARYYIAALLFIIPGPISDVVAIVLLLPWGGQGTPRPPADESILEGEYRRIDPHRNDKSIP